VLLLLWAALQQGQGAHERALAEGRRQLDLKRPGDAERAFREAVALDPADSASRYFLGVALRQQGKAIEAATELERARRLSPRPNPAVLYELGSAHIDLDRLDEAEEALREAARLAPGWDRIPLQLGWTFYLRVELEKAEEAFRQALAITPSATGHYYLGLAGAGLGRLEEAEGSFRQALALDASFADARIGLGRTLLRLNRREEAASAFRDAVSSDPGKAEAHYQLGLLSSERGDSSAARRSFEMALLANPSHQGACYNLSLLYEREGDTERARDMRARFQALLRKTMETAKQRTGVPRPPP
jgi:tetratricopeptide (TPR) repeat protein